MYKKILLAPLVMALSMSLPALAYDDATMTRENVQVITTLLDIAPVARTETLELYPVTSFVELTVSAVDEQFGGAVLSYFGNADQTQRFKSYLPTASLIALVTDNERTRYTAAVPFGWRC